MPVHQCFLSRNVRVQEMDHHARFVADLWKRFVADEEIDVRVNYGFTSKRRFGDSMKVQELNYENIPIIEEARDATKACQQIRRRIICLRMGKATFVVDPALVDHTKGIYLLIPQDELVPFLSHPLTSAIYFRDWCLPFFRENSLVDCVQMLSDLKAVHTDLERDTDWLASRLSGSSKGPPGDEHCNRCESEGIIQRVHEQTPMKPIIKEYLLQKVDDLPGAISSSRGRRTKTQNFIAALDSTGMLLFQQLDSGSFAKLQVNWARLSEIMCGHGGEAVFGGWAIWGNPFDLRHLQQHWEDKAFHDIFPSNSFVSDMNPHVRHAVVSLNESINLSALRSYALQ